MAGLRARSKRGWTSTSQRRCPPLVRRIAWGSSQSNGLTGRSAAGTVGRSWCSRDQPRAEILGGRWGPRCNAIVATPRVAVRVILDQPLQAALRVEAESVPVREARSTVSKGIKARRERPAGCRALDAANSTPAHSSAPARSVIASTPTPSSAAPNERGFSSCRAAGAHHGLTKSGIISGSSGNGNARPAFISIRGRPWLRREPLTLLRTRTLRPNAYADAACA